MSEAAEEAMDGSPASGEETDHTPKKQPSPDKPSLWGVGEIIEGKRAKKSVERLDMQVPKKPVKLSIGDGSGEKLGDIPRTSHRLNKMKPVDLVPLHNLLFDRRGKLSLIKKNLRQFNGFPFDADSEQFTKKRDKLQKNFTNTKLKFVCEVLDLEKKGTHADLVHRIMMFLVSPKSSGKRLPKKKKRSKKNLSGDDSKPKKNSKKRNGSKQKPSSNSSPKKSKAIVMDSSSDEEEEEEEEEGEGRKTETETDGSEAGSGAESGDKQEEEQSEDEEDEEEDEDESPKPKARGKAKMSALVKKTKSQTKPVKKRSRKEATGSESESSDNQPQKKKSKPAPKTKKADSSSNSKTNNTTADDSSDEDQPLIKMVRKAPSDQQLKETVQSLLKEADLEELTMKQICQKVFEAYSEHDLSSKKDFIKQTVKSLIT